MSYRTVKRLLGETSLERKCRFLFGGGLMLLIASSFYFYGRLTSRLVYEQNETTARLLISPILLEKHWKQLEGNKAVLPIIDEFAASLKPEDLREFSWKILKADPTTASPSERPVDDAGYDALEKLKRGQKSVVDILYDRGEYHYYGEVRAEKSCLRCHAARDPQVSEGDLLGMVKVSFPLERTKKSLAWNNAILLATAIFTAFLAMLAAYAIVRYVIVKPVLHLKDVSDEIARGNLDLRADIRTGDEFEELSHAFNRMLRHLTTVQDELRQVNGDLDGKVDELAQVNLRLYEMNKLKDEFLATMSHELRTPLNSILGFSEVLADAEDLDERKKRFVGNIQRSGRDLMLLINDLLDLAKIESGKMELQVTEFSLADLIERQLSGIAVMAERKNIALQSSIGSGTPVVSQDPGKLQQILNNLLSNAVKFTPEGGRVNVRARLADHRHFELIVEDTGIGIPLEDQETIFEKFRQGRSVPGQQDTMTREYGGTGLGLSIVRELSRLLGGSVTLQSEFGRGSLFTVRLPVKLDVRQLERDLEKAVPSFQDGHRSTTSLRPAPGRRSSNATPERRSDAASPAATGRSAVEEDGAASAADSPEGKKKSRSDESAA
ncbi:MAG: HAMP domain-containing protein [Planctomycetaceae bacterium]|nr:HAMP domain-containing protein [Planctomycetaceae bacterium]